MAGDDDPLTGVRDCIPELDVDQRALWRLGTGGELESEASDDQRLSVVLEERPGELARLGEATGGAGVNIEVVCSWRPAAESDSPHPGRGRRGHAHRPPERGAGGER
jgi:hypothetical protein